MHAELRANEQVDYFPFSAGSCLYRDHHGRRVVADAEGPGEFSIETADSRLLVIRDETAASEFQGRFDSSLTVIGSEDARGTVWIARCHHPLEGEPVRVDLPFRGSGWLLESGSVLEVDESGRSTPSRGPFPLPFFRSIRGEGDALLVPSSSECRLLDAWDIGDAAALSSRSFRVKNMSEVFPLASTFDNGRRSEAMVASHLNTASWQVEVPERCRGLRLRRLYDRFHGRQRARVLVDGAFAGWWYEPLEDRQRRWGWSWFGIPPELVRCGATVELGIDPPAGTPLWSVSRMEVFGLFL